MNKPTARKMRCAVYTRKSSEEERKDNRGHVNNTGLFGILRDQSSG
jgi:hypothetical protein